MSNNRNNVVRLKVLRVAAQGILGHTEPLNVVYPFHCSSARLDEIGDIAAEAARHFLGGLRKAKAI